ncbi:MAG TPA: HAMP domain-containing sensor histidine kinase [Candidatus Dormibacteraeota bacterium]|nr:HAMP domain-containing sensor histidine kinase [Candidatus Dormibacteraeota bacterium]
MSIRSRLAAGYGAGVVVTLVLVGLFVWWQMGAALEGSLKATLQTRSAGILTSLENAGQAGLQESDRATPGVFAALFKADGSLVDATTDAPRGIRPGNGVVNAGGRHYLVWTEKAPDGTIVVTGSDLQPIADAQAALARLLLAVGISVGIASLLGGWLLAGRALRPVDRLIDGAAVLGPGDLGRRLAPPLRMDEVGRLTLTLNGMLDRIAESVERQRLFIAMASHELRTPLAALRAELDDADRSDTSLAEYRQAVQDAQGDVIRLSSLVTSLLELAAIEEDARRVERHPVQLRELVSAVARSVDPLVRQHGVAIELDVPDAVVWIDRTRIEHALGNLLSNAVAYSRLGGTVEVHGRIEDERGRDTLVVEVLDRGPGIGSDPPDELFAPFHRGSHATGSGSGLGLATVAAAVRAHGGAFGAENRNGTGARFWFTVPAIRPDTSAVVIPSASVAGRHAMS